MAGVVTAAAAVSALSENGLPCIRYMARTFYTSAGYAQCSSGDCCVFTASRCLSRCLVPTWTRPQGGRVHYTHVPSGL